MISLLVEHPREVAPKEENEDDDDEDRSYAERYEPPLARIKGLFEIKATLIICPSQLVQQWANEIKNHSDLAVVEITTVYELRRISYQVKFSSSFYAQNSTNSK